jgi:superfamily II DNA or RNA helicase
MNTSSFVVLRDGIPCSILRTVEEWGIPTLELVSPPRRFWGDQPAVRPVVESGVDAKRVTNVRSPAHILQNLPDSDNWTAQSKRSIARLRAHFLICEDPQRRMDARGVVTLSHQVSLVRHILDDENLARVLIADEVGLGKTVEAGLLVKNLLEAKPGSRILYLAPARLVNNVVREFDRLEIRFRKWTSTDGDARLTDGRIVASIHRAVNGRNFDAIVNTDPWDLIIVDECHHLSDWAAGGGDPVEQFKLVRDLISKQRPDGWLVLLSGTPHQGNEIRFANLLGLLKRANEDNKALAGRVIYRSKDDVKDWRGNPLFPLRQVNDPIVVDLGPAYKQWLRDIHDFYKPPQTDGARRAKQRAAGWRCAQALQWAASSPHAGVGYLVRQAMRAGWALGNSILKDALAALRPYRNGAVDEEIDRLFGRIDREINRQKTYGDVDDIEDEENSDDRELLRQPRSAMEVLLRGGLEILSSSPDAKWDILKRKILDPAGSEKVVLFAQPIETVTALTGYLQRTTGERPMMIFGGQTEAERAQAEDTFRNSDAVRFLVSSRAGGEGINLQVARRLVHIDVPWNPMELEQRVGRVHRFGSRKTIIVDTLVVKDSRETDAFRVAREKLTLIASAIVGAERFEAVFSRVMCLLPPEGLQDVLIGGRAEPLSTKDTIKISEMVESGFKAWTDFHDRFYKEQLVIRQQDAGLATWDDLAEFLVENGGATNVDGFQAQRFELIEGLINPVEDNINALRMQDGRQYVCGDTQGAPVFTSGREIALQLGLNLALVTETLRKCAFPQTTCGAAHLRWPKEMGDFPFVTEQPTGVLIYLRQTLRANPQGGWLEQGAKLKCYFVDSARAALAIDGAQTAALLHSLFKAPPRLKPAEDESIVQFLQTAERQLLEELRQPSEIEIAQGVRYAVTPLVAAVVSR